MEYVAAIVHVNASPTEWQAAPTADHNDRFLQFAIIADATQHLVDSHTP